jgi:hypothetical protein
LALISAAGRFLVRFSNAARATFPGIDTPNTVDIVWLAARSP